MTANDFFTGGESNGEIGVRDQWERAAEIVADNRGNPSGESVLNVNFLLRVRKAMKSGIGKTR